MNTPVKWFVLGFMTILFASPAEAKNASTLTNKDLEFLEFLGSWETEDGEWLNPLELIEKPMDEQEHEGEGILYDPRDSGESDDGPNQTDIEDLETPIAPVSGDMIHD